MKEKFKQKELMNIENYIKTNGLTMEIYFKEPYNNRVIEFYQNPDNVLVKIDECCFNEALETSDEISMKKKEKPLEKEQEIYCAMFLDGHLINTPGDTYPSNHIDKSLKKGSKIIITGDTDIIKTSLLKEDEVIFTTQNEHLNESLNALENFTKHSFPASPLETAVMHVKHLTYSARKIMNK